MDGEEWHGLCYIRLKSDHKRKRHTRRSFGRPIRICLWKETLVFCALAGMDKPRVCMTVPVYRAADTA